MSNGKIGRDDALYMCFNILADDSLSHGDKRFAIKLIELNSHLETGDLLKSKKDTLSKKDDDSAFEDFIKKIKSEGGAAQGIGSKPWGHPFFDKYSISDPLFTAPDSLTGNKPKTISNPITEMFSQMVKEAAIKSQKVSGDPLSDNPNNPLRVFVNGKEIK